MGASPMIALWASKQSGWIVAIGIWTTPSCVREETRVGGYWTSTTPLGPTMIRCASISCVQR